MLTQDDIKNIVEAHREVFVTKEEMSIQFDSIKKNLATTSDLLELEERLPNKADMNKILDAVDAYAKQSKDYYQEVTIAVGRVNRMERFLSEVVAPKIGVKYEI